MTLKIERLAKYNQIYKLFNMLLDNDIDCDLYYTDKDFTIKFKKYPNLICVSGDITTKHTNTITYQNHTRAVNNLSAEKALERLLAIFNKNGGKNDRQGLEITKIER